MSGRPDFLGNERAFSPFDAEFVAAMARIGNERDPQVLIAMALACRALRQGHVCLDLGWQTGLDALHDTDDGEIVLDRHQGAAELWPREAIGWGDRLRASSLVGEPGDGRPFVLDAAGRLYLYRYWDHENQLAEALERRIAIPVEPPDPARTGWIRERLDQLFRNDRPPPGGAVDWQRVAVVLALLRPLSIITGGPGTGKTSTVVKILVLLAEMARRAGQTLPRVRLAAPTGKAALRLHEAIQQALGRLEVDEEVREAVSGQASTIHRLLGSIAGRSTAFRHHRGAPLPADIVLVDEASMIDVALMRRLVDAVPDHARLILLGDREQLASVEAGAVLGDLCREGSGGAYSRRLAAAMESILDRRWPGMGDGPGGLGDSIVRLEYSHRFPPESGIGQLARAIRAGEATEALALLQGGTGGIALAPGLPERELGEALSRTAGERFGGYLAAGGTERRLQRLGEFRILCAHRRGAAGVETVNPAIERLLENTGQLRLQDPFYDGRPLIILRNDYDLHLFNGDIGLVQEDGRRPFAWFPGGEEGGLRRIAPSRLPPHETVFAMTIHKSQGSEFGEVAVLLPPRRSPVLTRELLYTAVTRARQSVTVHADPDTVLWTIGHRVPRASGLAERLWGKPERQASLLTS